MSYSVWPHRWQPTRLPRPWDSPGKNIGVGCHFLPQCMKVKSESEVAQSCPTPCDPMDCSPPGSFIHGIFQARVLEWGAIAFSTNRHSCNSFNDQLANRFLLKLSFAMLVVFWLATTVTEKNNLTSYWMDLPLFTLKEAVKDFIFLGSKNHWGQWLQPWN